MNSLEQRLRRHVDRLAGEIGPRGLFAPAAYRAAADYIDAELASGGYEVTREPVPAPKDMPDAVCHNLVAERPGTDPAGIWLIGAHYDTVPGTPGADDNASAVAALLEMARHFAGVSPRDTVRFVALANEEMPHFTRPSHGAMAHAAGCRRRGEKIRLMASLEMLGYYTDQPGSQRYPAGLGACYPDTGNFLGIIGGLVNTGRIKRLAAGFRASTDLPCQVLITPVWAPALVRSDHFAFLLNRYPAVMITDTADFRNPHYHSAADTPNSLDYPRMAAAVTGLCGAFERLSGG
ncbi:MAG: M20/M25/M40 family metallo-hydrolase [Nitrospirota bacterium]|nr:M20/M25/M40 family metallo-hydrolase [Nitrospirota bacterium]